MRSVRLKEVLRRLVEEAAEMLHAEVAAGAEVPFEIEPRARGGRGAATALYCYRALTGEFIAAHVAALERLPSWARAAELLAGFPGLERYLASAGLELGRSEPPARARRALCVLLADVFGEQTDFELRSERLVAALERLEQSALPGGGEFTAVATLHGVAISSDELELARGLSLVRPDAVEGLPDSVTGPAGGQPPGHLLVLVRGEQEDPQHALATVRELLGELLRALRLFGDGRVTYAALAWTSIGSGAWTPLALGAGGKPRGVLLVTPDQEDELRAFCELVSRRTPAGDELAWALRRFELGCARERPYEALTDHLLALRALLEPEGPESCLLASRLAALCATPGARRQMTERVLAAIELERAVITGGAVEHAGGHELAAEMSGYLRALLRDVICGHLAPALAALADEILLAPEEPVAEPRSAEQVLGDAGEAEEILDLLI